MPSHRGPANDLGEHIARIAAQLFYSEGIHKTGVDRVAAEANVSKRTLYRYYSSKEDLVAAALRRSSLLRFPTDGLPADRIRGAFEALVTFTRTETFRGCPYINAAAELTDVRHPGREVVVKITTRRREWFEARVAEAGVANSEGLAEQLDVLFDGALANASKRNIETPATAALAAAQTLVAAALMQKRTTHRSRTRQNMRIVR